MFIVYGVIVLAGSIAAAVTVRCSATTIAAMSGSVLVYVFLVVIEHKNLALRERAIAKGWRQCNCAAARSASSGAGSVFLTV